MIDKEFAAVWINVEKNNEHPIMLFGRVFLDLLEEDVIFFCVSRSFPSLPDNKAVKFLEVVYARL